MDTFAKQEKQKKNIQHIMDYINEEKKRQETHIELIASENFVSPKILKAQGSVLTNKYAEGYPGARYYGGCHVVDHIENMAIESAKELFSCGFANVQPHSGSQANQAVYLALLKPGDVILSMDLGAGGHLTHGAPVSLTGKWFSVIHYGLNKDGYIDFQEVERLAKEHKPKLIVAGASSYPRFIDFQIFREIADTVGAYLMADMAHIAGLVATGYHPHVFPWAHVATTTTHKTLRGPRGGMILTNEGSLATSINRAVFPGLQGGPLLHVIAGKAICFQEGLDESYKDYIGRVVENAKILCETLGQEGLNMITGGTDNHLMIAHLGSLGFSGREGQERLRRLNITCNKNAVFQDPLPPRESSGLRFGTPALTTRGFQGEDMKLLGQWIGKALRKEALSPKEEDIIKDDIQKLLKQYPLCYENI